MGIEVIIEYIRYDIPSDRGCEFEAAWQRARSALHASSHCLDYEVGRAVEEPNHYAVRIEWDSAEGHEQGFRKSSEFADFFDAVRPFFDQIQEMRHYERTAIASGEAPRRAGAVCGEEYRPPEAQAALPALSSGATNGR